MEYLKLYHKIETPDELFSWLTKRSEELGDDGFKDQDSPDAKEFMLVMLAGRKFLLKQDISDMISDPSLVDEEGLTLQQFSISQMRRKIKMVDGDDTQCAALVGFSQMDMLPGIDNGKRRCKKKHRKGKKYCYSHRKMED